MFIDIYAKTECTDIDYELRYVRLYHNNGFRIGCQTLSSLKGKRFEWEKSRNAFDEEAGIMCVLEHENLTCGVIELLDVTQDAIKIKWTGYGNIYWDDKYNDNIPFETVIETKLPEIPKIKVLNGLKTSKLKNDENTELELLNFEDILEEYRRCTKLWHNNDKDAREKFNAILHLKIIDNDIEYLGKAVYEGSTRQCQISFDTECPKEIEIEKTIIDPINEEYNFYIKCK